MTAPNLVAITSWTEDTQSTVCTIAPQTCCDAPATDHIREVVAIHATNVSGTKSWLTITAVRTGGNFERCHHYAISANGVPVNINIGRECVLRATETLVCEGQVDNAIHVEVTFNDLTSA